VAVTTNPVNGILWSDTVGYIATKYDLDTLSGSIYDTLSNHLIIINSWINDSSGIIHWIDTIGKISTRYDIDTLSTNVYDSLNSHLTILNSWVNDSVGVVHWFDTASYIATKYDTVLFLAAAHEKIRSDTIISATDGLMLMTFDNPNLYSTIDNAYGGTIPVNASIMKSGTNNYFSGVANYTSMGGRKTSVNGWTNAAGTERNFIYGDSLKCQMQNRKGNDFNDFDLSIGEGLRLFRSQDGINTYLKFQVDTAGRMYNKAGNITNYVLQTDSFGVTSTATGIANTTIVTQDTLGVVYNIPTSGQFTISSDRYSSGCLQLNGLNDINIGDYNGDYNNTYFFLSDGQKRIMLNNYNGAYNYRSKLELDTASITSTVTGISNTTTVTQDTSNYSIVINSDTAIKVNQSGSVRFSESYTFPIVDGASSQVIKTDGSGNLSWTNPNVFSAGDSIMLVSPDLADTNYIFNDNDTMRIRGDNPIKIGNNSLIISDDLSKFGGTVEIKNGDTLKSNLIIPNLLSSDEIRLGMANTNVAFYPDSSKFFNIADFRNATVLGISTGTSPDSLVQVIKVNGWLGGNKIEETKVWNIENVLALIDSGTVDVYRGYYTTTGNIAKNGVTWIAHGSNILKTTSGAIFDCSDPATYTKDIKILGDGKYFHTTNAGSVLKLAGNTNTKTCTFEFNECSATNDITLDLVDVANAPSWNIYLKGNKCLSSGGTAIDAVSNGTYSVSYQLVINIGVIGSTAGYAYNNSGYQDVVNADYIYSTSTDAVYIYGTRSIHNINYCYSASGNGYYSRSYAAILNGSYSSIWFRDTQISFNGICYGMLYANSSPGSFVGGSVYAITCSDGTIRTTKAYSSGGVTGNVIVAGGCVELWLINDYELVRTSAAIVSGGTLTLRGTSLITYAGSSDHINITGGRLNIFADITVSTAYGGVTDIPITLFHQTGGVVEWKGTFKHNINAAGSCMIYKTGGTLILNGATFVKNGANSQFILCPTTAQDIKIYSGGCNTNGTAGELLSAKKLKRKYVVSAVATTIVVLNDGSGGDETFTEADIVTYDTKAKLAQRMAELINASGTLDCTASQDIAGTDEYFYVEADVAGTPFTESGLVNLVGTNIRLNSYLITNLTGGTLIEDTDVTY
jgi:hypothetical protein